ATTMNTTITKNIITMTMMSTADAAATTMSTSITKSIITTIMMNTVDAAAMITIMDTIITTMQMKFLQAGAVKHLVCMKKKKSKRLWKHWVMKKHTEWCFVQKVCCRMRMVYGITLIWFRKKLRFEKEALNLQAEFV
ncbi:MAG: hypothetical protein IJ486_10575, partial [Firmicutes bacterium]|nr:hypothetical protein [Bacillota bacterium]